MILLQLQRQSIQVAKINNNQFHFSTFQKGWWKILIRQNNLRTARNINYKTNTQLYLMGSCRSDKAVGWIHYPLTRKWSHGVNATQGRLHLSKGNGRIYEPNLFHPSGFIERKKKKSHPPGFSSFIHNFIPLVFAFRQRACPWWIHDCFMTSLQSCNLDYLPTTVSNSSTEAFNEAAGRNGLDNIQNHGEIT